MRNGVENGFSFSIGSCGEIPIGGLSSITPIAPTKLIANPRMTGIVHARVFADGLGCFSAGILGFLFLCRLRDIHILAMIL